MYRLTTYQVLPASLPEYINRTKDRQWGALGILGEPVGVWQSVVGDLSRIFFLHRETEAFSEGSATRAYRVEGSLENGEHILRREVQLLTEVKPVVLPATPAGLYELRKYTLTTGGLRVYVPLLLDVLAARETYSPNVGIWTAVTGPSDQLIHLWAYSDASQRSDLRPLIDADPAWKAFVPKILPLIREMQSYFLSPIVLNSQFVFKDQF